MRSSLLVLAVLALVADCGAPAAAPAAPAATTPPAATSSTPVTPPGTIALTGAVESPSTLTAQQLAGMPQQTVQVSFGSGKGPEQHSETGVSLAALLPADALATTDRKNDQLAFGVLAIGDDGYAAAVSHGEVSADFGNRGLLVARTEDGKALDRPRLVVPGDVKGGRYVSGLVELRVVGSADLLSGARRWSAAMR